MSNSMQIPILTRRMLIGLAIWTLFWFVLSGILGNHHPGLRGTVADISWTCFVIGLLLLVVSAALVLVRSAMRRRARP